MARRQALSSSILAKLAWRNLWRNYRRTIIMLLAVILGVWAMILFSSLMRGMVDEMVHGGLRALPGEAQIHHPDYIDDPSVVNSMDPPSGDLLRGLEAAPIEAWTTRVKVPGMISSERANRGVQILGVDPAGEIALGFNLDDLVEGRFLNGPDDPGLVIGRKLAQRLETRLGKRLVIMSQSPDNEVADRGARIVGIYRARLQATEELLVYTGREPLQAVLDIDHQVSEIAVTANDYQSVDQWWPALAAAAGAQLDTRPWYVLDAYLGTMTGLQSTINLIVMVIIFLALSFGLVNTLVMAVFERVREIGLMMALGMRPQWVLYQVLLESLMLLALGLIIGNVLAVATILPLEDGIDLSFVGEGMEMFGYGTMLYPSLALADMLLSTVVVLVLGLLASLLPAWRAARYNPVQAINKQ